MLPSSQLRDVTVRDYLVIIRRRFVVILICFVFSTINATLKTIKKIPLYQANARIIIERSIPQVAPIQQVYTPSWGDKEYMQSQMNILTSRTMGKKVVESLIADGDNSFVGMRESEQAFLSGASVGIVPGTQLVNVGYISPDPVKAAKYANALATVYIRQDVDRRIDASKYATGWLETQLTELKIRLQAAEASLNDYIKTYEIVSVPDIERKAQTILDGLKRDKIDIENELMELSKRYKSKHPKIITLNTRLEAVTKSIEDETQKLLALNDKMIKYNALKREVESNKSLYEALLKRTKETEVAKELEATNIRIIDLAEVPKAPFSPNKKRDVSSGALLGLILGLGLALFWEYLDSTVKSAEEIEIYVRLPFLGYIPSAKREAKTEKDIDLITNKLPHSRIAEAYRSVRTSIIFSAPEDKPLKTILITSTSPQEGKTTVTINLGIIFAHSNEKTLILEADLRKPRITNSLGIPNKDGLSSLLAGTATLEQAVKQTIIPNLFLITSGPKPPNPAELLASARARHLLEELKTKFDRIIIDSPPVLTVADTAILANKVDGVIDIIRARFRNIEDILRGRQRLNEAKSNIIGVILNNVNVRKEDSYYYYHYYYAEDKGKNT